VGQALPQPPQLVALVLTSTQPDPHRLWPAGQVHVPAMQALPAGQALAQPPQLALLLAVSTQAPPHRVWPVGQPHT
jgi:hypothetical protein